MGTIALLLGASSLGMAYNTMADRTWENQQHQRVLNNIAQESEERKALFERFAQEGSGVTLQNYQCDPVTPPSFDPLPWAREGQDWPVYDRNSIKIGEIRPDGTYRHFGYCSP